MPDSELVICDNTDSSVKVLTDEFKLINKLKPGPRAWDVASVSKTEVIVTEPDSKSLQFLTVSNGIEKGKSVSVGMNYYGIDCKNDKLYLTCHDKFETRGEVVVLTMDGVTVNSIDAGRGYPDYVSVTVHGLML